MARQDIYARTLKDWELIDNLVNRLKALDSSDRYSELRTMVDVQGKNAVLTSNGVKRYIKNGIKYETALLRFWEEVVAATEDLLGRKLGEKK